MHAIAQRRQLTMDVRQACKVIKSGSQDRGQYFQNHPRTSSCSRSLIEYLRTGAMRPSMRRPWRRR